MDIKITICLEHALSSEMLAAIEKLARAAAVLLPDPGPQSAPSVEYIPTPGKGVRTCSDCGKVINRYNNKSGRTSWSRTSWRMPILRRSILIGRRGGAQRSYAITAVIRTSADSAPR